MLNGSPESFNKEFENNKKAIGKSLSSKKVRNKIAGYITRLKKNQKTIIDDQE